MSPLDSAPERFGPFVLLRQLGVGGMGSAHLALHPETDSLLVVKRMHKELMKEEGIFKRFVHEAEVAAHVQHENVAGMVAMGTVDSEPFLATEFVFGIQLSRIIDRIEENRTDQVPLNVALFLSVALCKGLEAIHESRHRETGEPLGLIHRDVGARNVLLGFDGVLKLIDLGLGKSILSDWQTAHDVLAGSPDYMPPEQAMGARVDGRADVYAAAVTAWEVIAGRKRIREDNVTGRLRRAIGAQPEPLRVHREDASERLEAVLKQAMATDPERRTPTAQILRRGLEEELRHHDSRTSLEDVVSWLDVSCAIIIARDRRRLEEDRHAAKHAMKPERAHTQILVGRPDLTVPMPYRFYVPEAADQPVAKAKPGFEGTLQRIAENETLAALAALVDPQNLKRASLRAKLLLAVIVVGVLAAVAAVTAILVAPRPIIVTAERLPAERDASPDLAPVPPPPPAAIDDDDDDDDPELPLVAPPPLPPPPAAQDAPPPPPPEHAARGRLSPELEQKKSALVSRIRALRRVSFDIAFQRKLTKLSARLSGARSAGSLDDIERSLRKLEQGN